MLLQGRPLNNYSDVRLYFEASISSFFATYYLVIPPLLFLLLGFENLSSNHGKLPRHKYNKLNISDSKSSRLLCSIQLYFVDYMTYCCKEDDWETWNEDSRTFPSLYPVECDFHYHQHRQYLTHSRRDIFFIIYFNYAAFW